MAVDSAAGGNGSSADAPVPTPQRLSAPGGIAANAKLAEVARLTERLAQRFDDVEHMSVAELGALLGDPASSGRVVLVDVREPEERAVSTLPGALSQPEFEARKESLDRDAVIVVAYCTIGGRSSMFARSLKEQGFLRAANLAGSALAWVAEGQPVVDPATGQETQRLHCFAERWALAPDHYETVVFSSPWTTYGLRTLRSWLPSWLGSGGGSSGGTSG